MQEYRRFIAYFYEYIDGKKQKNAGFAKVELRNGMWRVLFRLTLPDAPESPLQVYGFVREQGYLLEFPLGIRNAGGGAAEEWAWRADAPVGFGSYYFNQMTGLRIQSEEGRVFLTVWDEEPVDPGRFVTELPMEEAFIQPELVPVEEMVRTGSGLSIEEPAGIPEVTPVEEPNPPGPEMPEREPAGIPEVTPVEEPNPPGPEMPEREPDGIPEVRPLEEPGLPETKVPVQNAAGMPGQNSPEVPEIQREPDSGVQAQEMIPAMVTSILASGETPFSEPERESSAAPAAGRARNHAEDLLRGCQKFQPFQDDEIADCVQIKLCDLLPLQQEGWQVGRSNFTQHGYYLYRHLLFGRTKDGGYVLGVPGVRSRQEEYIAGVFGYRHFKLSGRYRCGKQFGYWYRILNAPGERVTD